MTAAKGTLVTDWWASFSTPPAAAAVSRAPADVLSELAPKVCGVQLALRRCEQGVHPFVSWGGARGEFLVIATLDEARAEARRWSVSIVYERVTSASARVDVTGYGPRLPDAEAAALEALGPLSVALAEWRS